MSVSMTEAPMRNPCAIAGDLIQFRKTHDGDNGLRHLLAPLHVWIQIGAAGDELAPLAPRRAIIFTASAIVCGVRYSNFGNRIIISCSPVHEWTATQGIFGAVAAFRRC